MDHLNHESLDWAMTHIRRFGDTDIFPVPFEYEAVKHSWPNLKQAISEIDIATYEARAFRRFLVPKQISGYRVAIQLDPIDTIIYTALAYEVSEQIENNRVPIERKIACSYRVELSSDGSLFRKKNGWDDFHDKSSELAQSGEFQFVLTADIADFFNQIGHHRVRNALELAGIDKCRAKNIENLLMNFTRGQSQGLPIGPSASALFSEACLSDVDNYLLRQGYIHTRYVDDFRIFCTTMEGAQRALHDLTEYLYTTHRLSLQSHKTRVFDVNEFIGNELIDPEELENRTKEEKLEAIKDYFSQYSEFTELKDTSVDEVVRKNLTELFEACLGNTPIHLGTAKYLLRRATSIRTGVLREAVLSNLRKLTPIMREATLYLEKTTSKKFAREVGEGFISGCLETDSNFLPYVQFWLLEFLIQKTSGSMENEISTLCEKYKANLGQRPYALLARKNKQLDWVRAKKETWNNNSPWDRRAIIWAARALSSDEMNYWLKRVQNAGDILDKAIAESVLNTEKQ